MSGDRTQPDPGQTTWIAVHFKGQRIFKLASLLPPLCLRFSFFENLFTKGPLETEKKMKVLSPIFIWRYQAFYQIIVVAFQSVSYLMKKEIQK